MDGTDYISTMLGTFISSYIFNAFGFYAVYGSSAALALLAVLYVAFVIKESVGFWKQKEAVENVTKTEDDPLKNTTNLDKKGEYGSAGEVQLASDSIPHSQMSPSISAKSMVIPKGTEMSQDIKIVSDLNSL